MSGPHFSVTGRLRELADQERELKDTQDSLTAADKKLKAAKADTEKQFKGLPGVITRNEAFARLSNREESGEAGEKAAEKIEEAVHKVVGTRGRSKESLLSTVPTEFKKAEEVLEKAMRDNKEKLLEVQAQLTTKRADMEKQQRRKE